MASNITSSREAIAAGFSAFTENPLLDNLEVGKREKTMMEAYALFMTGAFLATYPRANFFDAYSAVRDGIVHGAGLSLMDMTALRERLGHCNEVGPI